MVPGSDEILVIFDLDVCPWELFYHFLDKSIAHNLKTDGQILINFLHINVFYLFLCVSPVKEKALDVDLWPRKPF